MPAVESYIDHLQRYEEYAFSWEELTANCDAPESTLRKEVTRLTQRNHILNVRKGFYVILPPRYRNLGKLPLPLYVDKLFRHLEKHYYVALYSAAGFHGASHQQIQQDYGITVPPALLKMEKGNLIVRFFKTIHWPDKNIAKKKSDAGYFNISSPASTPLAILLSSIMPMALSSIFFLSWLLLYRDVVTNRFHGALNAGVDPCAPGQDGTFPDQISFFHAISD